MDFQRPHIQELIKRINEPRGFIQVIAGPRQVGKTTLVQQFLDEYPGRAHFASADAAVPASALWIEQQWAIARRGLARENASEWLLVIDEIQKIPNWSAVVKAEWDADSRQRLPIKVILLGSSRLLLQQGLTESLAGRFELMYLGHWSFAEMQAAFRYDADTFAWFGGYPGTARLIQEESRWKKYVQDALIDTSINRDILQMTRVDKPALMRRLFELGALHSGQILAYNKMLGQLTDAGNTTTLAHYLELLDTAGLLSGLEKYAGAQIRQRASSPKFQVHNTALLSAQRAEKFEEAREKPELWGRIVESTVGAHLLNFSRETGAKLFYWREGDLEVDFILQYQGRLLAIEVKSGQQTRSLGGLEKFRQTAQPDRSIVIGRGGLPWEEFLHDTPANLF